MEDYCTKRTSPMYHGLIEHQLGGAVSRVDREATAFNHRDIQYSFMTLGVCTGPAEVERCARWAREFCSNLGALQILIPSTRPNTPQNYDGRHFGPLLPLV